MVETSAPSFVQSLSGEEVTEMLGPLVRRTFEAGSVVLAEGDSPNEMHVMMSGLCGVFVTSPAGSKVQIGQYGPGAGLQSFAKGRPFIARGEAAAEAALPQIAATLPWLR